MSARSRVVWLASVGLGAVVLAGAAPGPAAGQLAGASEGTAEVAAQAAPGDPPGTWWYDAIGLDEAHATGATGEGVVVGVIDSVVDPTVPELAGADVVPAFNACRVADPDATPQQAFGSGRGAVHGTVVTSLIVGTGDGNGPTGQGTRGVAPDATVRVYAMHELGGLDLPAFCQGAGSPPPGEAVRTAFERAVADGVDVINFSARVDVEGALDAVLAEASERGIVVVAAAGNEGRIEYPASAGADLGVVAVNPVGPTAELPQWSPRDPAVAVTAPGLELLVGTATIDGWRSEAWGGGSSYATAVVTGALAVVKSRYPEATGNELVQHLVRHTTDDELRHDPGYGFGILALQEMLASDPTAWHDVNPLTQVSSLPALPEEYPDSEATDEAAAVTELRAGDRATATTASGAPVAEAPREPGPGLGIEILWAAVPATAALLIAVAVAVAVVRGSRHGARASGRPGGSGRVDSIPERQAGQQGP